MIQIQRPGLSGRASDSGWAIQMNGQFLFNGKRYLRGTWIVQLHSQQARFTITTDRLHAEYQIV